MGGPGPPCWITRGGGSGPPGLPSSYSTGLVPPEQHKDAQAGSEEPLLQFSDGELSEVAQPLPQVVHYDQYHEPVLEYDDI